MLSGKTDRLWLIGGAVAAVVLVAASWFLLIHPADQQTASIEDQTASAWTQQATLQHKLAQLQEQSKHLTDYQAELTNNRAALPTTADLTKFLRDLQNGDARRGVVTGVQVSEPLPPATGGGSAYALPVTVTASGSAVQLEALLDYLQLDQPRAVLIKGVSFDTAGGGGAPAPGPGASGGPGGAGGSVAKYSNLSVSLDVFVAGAVPAPAATPAPAPS